MTLSVLLFLAVALPLTLVAALLLFVRGVTWVDARPHRRRWLIGSLGLIYGGLALGSGLTEGWRWFAILQLVGSISMLAAAVFEKPRQENA